MGALNRTIFHRDSVDANTMVSITEDGKRAIDRDMIGEIKAYALMAELDQHSPQSLASLSKKSNANIYAVKREVDRLRKQGMVRTLDFRED